MPFNPGVTSRTSHMRRIFRRPNRGPGHWILWASLMVMLPAMARGDWVYATAGDQRQARPPRTFRETTPIRPGDHWPNDHKFRWLIGDLEIPDVIGSEISAGRCVALQVSCGDGGEVWYEGELQARYDNDHPALIKIADEALPGSVVKLVVQVYGKVQGGDRFDQANWVIVESRRAEQALPLRIEGDQMLGPVPHGLVGLSQGGGMSDYEDATAATLREAGFRWFRMDNVLTQVLRRDKNTGLISTNWDDFDRRLDFLHKMEADAILAVSYMPQVLDAVPNNERQSAPNGYAAWENLCYEAARRAIERGRRVAFWEVWNEVNTGWLKPGPQDTGSERFRRIYNDAIGGVQTNDLTVRRFEAYCKLYRATARGVRRADPAARIGGPALASGPMERSKDCGHCSNGRGFAKGLMQWCREEQLPLDFVSWHEYFQSPETIAREAATFRAYLQDYPELQRSVSSFMLTEWNTAWWPDRPQDHELGAAWCANTVIRAFLPAAIDRPCFFYAKQGDNGFRGDYSLLMGNNVPKPAYHMAKIFNGLSGRWLAVNGTDADVSAVASWDAGRSRLAVVLVNYRDRHAFPRRVDLQIAALPAAIRAGTWSEWRIDATHANAWHDAARAQLSRLGTGSVTGSTYRAERQLPANSVTLIELLAP